MLTKSCPPRICIFAEIIFIKMVAVRIFYMDHFYMNCIFSSRISTLSISFVWESEFCSKEEVNLDFLIIIVFCDIVTHMFLMCCHLSVILY